MKGFAGLSVNQTEYDCIYMQFEKLSKQSDGVQFNTKYISIYLRAFYEMIKLYKSQNYGPQKYSKNYGTEIRKFVTFTCSYTFNGIL